MKYDYDVLIIGSGAAGYAAAERICEKGIKNICVVTENRMLSTSRCSGSDKQTYYKLDIASDSGDSVRKMAEDMYAGGSMNGSDAYIEAAASLGCFMHLCEIGVPFPCDEYGIYQGYRTDHDNTKRATSCGPLTSKYMTEKLEKRVLEYNIPVLDGYKAIKLLVDNKKCYGAFCLHDGEIVKLTSKFTVLCTGAPAAIYADSVYPAGHIGATGIAADAGASLSNFQEWQYGIATTEFRWNLSGSYQQVIPSYFSVDKNGNKYDFLSNIPDVHTKIFLKGYEWPFNCKKTEGSSLIDIKIIEEKAKGRKVFIDYTKNPSGFDFALLSKEAKDYLEEAGVNGKTPFERLMQLNPAAVKLYKDNGIDLSVQAPEVGVCSQHNNGGIKVDKNGETNIENLYCCGEASGRFGVYRPGGAALNDTQVGATLVSKSIASKSFNETDIPDFEIRLPDLSNESNVNEINSYFARKMSSYAGAMRIKEEITTLADELSKLIRDFNSAVKISGKNEYSDYYNLYHTSVSRFYLCVTELVSLDKIGSRGGCICCENGKAKGENKDYLKFITVTDSAGVSFEKVDDIPENNCVFEKLLKGYKN